MKHFARYIAAALIALWPLQSFAASTTFTGKDASGATLTFDATSDASSHLAAWQVICDFSALANCATVNASHQLGTVEANSAAILSALGTPFQAGGSIANTGFNALQGGSANAVGNPFFVSPGTGASFTVANGGTFAVQAASTVSDGSDVTQGAKADSVCGTATGTCSLVALNKFIANAVSGAIPAGTNVIGFNSNDPCSQGTKLGAPISLTASGQIITGTSAKKTYVCSINLVSATAQNIALVEGTGTVCATNIFGLAGGTTAATGWNLSANGGLAEGSGVGTVVSPSGDTNGTAANVCLLLSSTGQTSGHITYVQQ